MKRTILALTAALAALSAGAASAQPYRDHDHDGVPNRYDRHDERHDNRGHHRWARGERLSPPYHSRAYVVSDWRRHHWRAPPRGYAYYRTDSGDVVLAAVATGLISSVILNAMNN
jgi:Ni/Co efflux regulator RcnB